MNPPVQNVMGGAQLHTPQSIFQHMMGQQQNAPQEAGQWMQIPQVPQLSMPWSIPSLQQPDLVRFTGERSQPKVLNLHQKRKLEMPDLVDTGRSKQFITEEKMAAHFRQMHIDPQYQPTADAQPSTSVIPPQQGYNQFFPDCDLEMDGASLVEQVKKPQPKLVFSEELKRLKEEPLLPVSLLSKLARPSMALVLWEPPNKYLRPLPSPRDTPTQNPNVSDDNNNANNIAAESGNNNNNNEGIPDMNDIFSNHAVPSLEPMDL
ncbi:uncharacterized protein LOC117169320 isoform X2 [Belonocnema kinseyi]|nr:uncharacterized protein LOC117169320 isoform X2 [Belonocnema kinseyi]